MAHYELIQTPEGGFHFDPVVEIADVPVLDTPTGPEPVVALVPEAPVAPDVPAVAPPALGHDLAPPVPAGAETPAEEAAEETVESPLDSSLPGPPAPSPAEPSSVGL